MKMRPSFTAGVAVLALIVGSFSAVGGVLNQKAADRKVCNSKIATNAAVRGLLDDFLTGPNITLTERQQADAKTLKRFPAHC